MFSSRKFAPIVPRPDRDPPPASGALARPTKRRKDRVCDLPYVRIVEGGLYQSRIKLNAFWGAISLGLYRTEAEAAAASRAVLRLIRGHTLDPLAAWEATRRAIKDGFVRADVQPKYVVKRGGKFYVRFSKADPRVLGPFPTAVQACLAAMDQRLTERMAVRSVAQAS